MKDVMVWARRKQGSHRRGHYEVTTEWTELPEAVARDAQVSDPDIEVITDKAYKARIRAKESGEAAKKEE